MPVALFTEGLGAVEQRLRDGIARLGIYFPLPPALTEFEVQPLADILMVPVVAMTHPLASLLGPITDDQLRGEVQLVLTDRSPNTGPSRALASPARSCSGGPLKTCFTISGSNTITNRESNSVLMVTTSP